MDPAEVKMAIRLAVGFNVLFLVVAVLLAPFNLFGGQWIFLGFFMCSELYLGLV